MKSEIKVYSYPNGEIQRVQVVRWDDWSKLEFLPLKNNKAALECFRDIYKNYLVPGCPWVFGKMILFQIPEGIEVKFPFNIEKYGCVEDKLTAATAALQEGVKIVCGKPIFTNSKVKKFWQALEAKNSIHVVCGNLPFTKVIPVGKFAGVLSENEEDAAMKVNAPFFIMDSFDCATAYDHVGKPFGLCVKDGIVENPPLYGREALLVEKDRVFIKELDVRDLKIEINGKAYVHDKNATIYTRSEISRTPADKTKKLVIVGNKVVAVKEHGSVPIPASGFVLCPDGECVAEPGDAVVYQGLEDVKFGIQVGNSIIKNGIKTEEFISRFYNIRKLERIPFPPSLYPMDFQKGRAARIALGSDKEGKPMLFWAEGAGKLNYVLGEDSTGASLAEMAEIAADLGMVNGINLDGGGSAQILMNNERYLRISDRNKENNSDAERLVPLGLVVR